MNQLEYLFKSLETLRKSLQPKALLKRAKDIKETKFRTSLKHALKKVGVDIPEDIKYNTEALIKLHDKHIKDVSTESLRK